MRGCVRVTGVGVEAVVEGCTVLEKFDVSQCKNLSRWLDGGGVERWERKRRLGAAGKMGRPGGKLVFETSKRGGKDSTLR